MRELTRKLIMSIIAVLFCIIALGTTTFAWFTLNQTVKVEQIEMNVTNQAGLEISLDNEHWYSNLSADMINKYIGDNFKLEALTYGKLNSSNEYRFYEITDAMYREMNEGFINLTFYFRTTESNREICLGEKSYIKSEDIAWTSDVNTEHLKAGNSYTFNGADAIKMSIANVNNETKYFYNPTSNDREMSTNGLAKEYCDAKGYKVSNEYINLPNSYIDMSTLKDTFNNQTIICRTDNKLASDNFYHTSIKVNLWLEGWDGDCINSILNATINYSLTFTLKKLYEY